MAVSVKNSLAIENLAETDIIFSDKTGTLTKNQMTFTEFVDCEGEARLKKDLKGVPLFCLGLCNTVLPQENRYEGESPDEVSFAIAARDQGLSFVNRHQFDVFYDFCMGDLTVKIKYRLLAVIPFTSLRKKMSVIMQEIGTNTDDGIKFYTPSYICKPGAPFLITKGADSFVFPLMTELSEVRLKQI